MKWQDVSNGPDWTDVRLFLSTMEKHYEVHITMMLSPVGRYDGVAMLVTVAASWVSLGELGATGTCSISERWPHREHKTMEGLAYSLAHQMDMQLTGKRFGQRGLWD